MFKESVVFHSDDDRYSRMRIPGIVVTSRGTLLAYCEGRSSLSSWSPMDILIKRSLDSGDTWSPIKIIAKGIENYITYNNPVMIVDNDGVTIHMIYCKEYEQIYYIKSIDDGLTWSKPIDITYAFNEYKDDYNWCVVATSPGHGIQLIDGTLIVSIWMSKNKSHNPSVVSTIYSKDFGDTWHGGEIIWDNKVMINPSESSILELHSGEVMINIKNMSTRKKRALSISKNGINNWTTPFLKEEFIDSTCFSSMIKTKIKIGDKENNIIVFSNINNKFERKNLTITMSKDQGITWPLSISIYEGNYVYSDLAVSNDNKKIYCIFEKDDTNSLVLVIIDLSWIAS